MKAGTVCRPSARRPVAGCANWRWGQPNFKRYCRNSAKRIPGQIRNLRAFRRTSSVVQPRHNGALLRLHRIIKNLSDINVMNVAERKGFELAIWTCIQPLKNGEKQRFIRSNRTTIADIGLRRSMNDEPQLLQRPIDLGGNAWSYS